MYDVFSFERGKILFDTEELYGKIFFEARSKTAEHKIYERSSNTLAHKNENSQKLKKIKERER